MSAAVHVEGLGKRFGNVEAVRALGFEVQRGELFGLVGPDGAGKTSTLRMLAGLLRPSQGTVRILGVDPFGRDSAAVRESLGLVPQEHSLYGDLSIEENLSFFRDLYRLPRREYDSRRQRLLEITRLSSFTDRRAAQLSGGMYKKLALCCALLHQPDVLLLDEPTNGVDPVSRRELWDLLYDFVRTGTSIVVSTPYMDEAARCHRVGLVHRGELLRMGAPTDLVRRFEGRVREVTIDRGELRPPSELETIHAAVESASGVVASTPAGSRIRVVLRPDGESELATRLAPLGASLSVSSPDFEDLFLFEIARASDAEKTA